MYGRGGGSEFCTSDRPKTRFGIRVGVGWGSMWGSRKKRVGVGVGVGWGLIGGSQKPDLGSELGTVGERLGGRLGVAQKTALG